MEKVRALVVGGHHDGDWVKIDPRCKTWELTRPTLLQKIAIWPIPVTVDTALEYVTDVYVVNVWRANESVFYILSPSQLPAEEQMQKLMAKYHQATRPV